MANLSPCIPHLEAWEGGLDNNPKDPGGLTNHGIILKFWVKYSHLIGLPPTPEALINLTWEQAIPLYKQTFWQWMAGDQIKSQKIAATLFDHMVNADELSIAEGVTKSKAIAMMQRIIGVKDDGVMGPDTITAINAVDENVLFAKYQNARKEYYNAIVSYNPNLKEFLHGWTLRVNAIA